MADSELHARQVLAANRARRRASNRLRELHRDEWEALYVLEATNEGLVPRDWGRDQGPLVDAAAGSAGPG